MLRLLLLSLQSLSHSGTPSKEINVRGEHINSLHAQGKDSGQQTETLNNTAVNYTAAAERVTKERDIFCRQLSSINDERCWDVFVRLSKNYVGISLEDCDLRRVHLSSLAD